MFGFLVGALCLYGLYRMRRGSFRRGLPLYALAGEGGAQSLPLRRLFHKLDTTPAQEQVIVAALKEAKESAKGIRDEAQKTREDVVNMFKSEKVEADELGAAFARQDEALDVLREGTTKAFAKIHNALDENQRAILARYVKRF